MFSASNNKSVKLWNLETLKAIKTYKGHEDYISDIKVLSNNVLVSSSGGAIYFWNIKSAKLLCTLLFSYEHRNQWLCVTPSGDYDCRDDFKGTIRWDYGKYNFYPNKGIGFDAKGNYNYVLKDDSNGDRIEHLLSRIIHDTQMEECI